MTEYITRSSALQAVGDVHPLDYNGQGIVERIKRIPAADVVEVVRCRDCEWWGHTGCAISIVDDTDKPGENDFCSFGERKDGGQDE